MAGYTVEQRALAVEVIEREGGLTNEAIAIIRELLHAPGLSKSTLHGWWSSNRTEPNLSNRTEPVKKAIPQEVRQQAAETLDDLFEAVARRYLQHAYSDDVIADTKGKDAITAAAIAVDKMRLLRGLPTEIVAIVPELVEALRGAGLDPVQAFNDMIAELANADRPGTHSTGEGETVR